MFTKYLSSVVGSDEPVEFMSHLNADVDYEAELAVITAHVGRDIVRADAMNQVWELQSLLLTSAGILSALMP